MISIEFQEALKPIERLYNALWVVLTSTMFMFFLVLVLLSQNQPDKSFAMDSMVRNVLIFLAVVAAAGSLYYRRHNRSKDYRSRLMVRNIQLKDVEDRAVKLVVQAKTDPKVISQLSLLTSFDRKRYCLVADLFLPFVVNLALNESVALLGFVLALPSRDVGIYIPFAGAGLLLNVYVRPDLYKLMERCEQWRVS